MARRSRGRGDGAEANPRAKKLRAEQQDGKEEEDDDDDEEAAKFVHPIDEVGDHNLNDDEKAWIQQDSDEGDMIFQLETLPSRDNDCDGEEDAETADGFNVWMRKLEDLRDKLRHESRGDVRAKPSVDELLGQLRQALKDGNWLPVTAARAVPRSSDAISVVRNLSRQETLETLRALVARHEHPPEQPNSSMWINFVLDYEVHDLHGSAELRSILRPLLISLRHELGQSSHAGQVLSCVVKWRLALGLAKERKAPPDAGSEAEEDDLAEDAGADQDDSREAAGDPASSNAESDIDDE